MEEEKYQDQRLEAMLIGMVDQQIRSSSGRSGFKIERCPSPPRLATGRLTADEHLHVRDCKSCQRRLPLPVRFWVKRPRALTTGRVCVGAAVVTMLICFLLWCKQPTGSLMESAAPGKSKTPVVSVSQNSRVSDPRSIDDIDIELLRQVGNSTYLVIQRHQTKLTELGLKPNTILELRKHTLQLAGILKGQDLIKVETIRLELAEEIPQDIRDETVLHLSDDELRLASLLRPRDLLRVAQTRVKIAQANRDAIIEFSRELVNRAPVLGSAKTVTYANDKLLHLARVDH
jgi:hypothetical protein